MRAARLASSGTDFAASDLFALGLLATAAGGHAEPLRAVFTDSWPKPTAVVILEQGRAVHLAVVTDSEECKVRAGGLIDELRRRGGWL